jgi:hypothetical protein
VACGGTGLFQAVLFRHNFQSSNRVIVGIGTRFNNPSVGFGIGYGPTGLTLNNVTLYFAPNSQELTLRLNTNNAGNGIGGSHVTSSAIPVNISQFNVFETEIVAATNGSVRVLVNGVQHISASNINTVGQGATIGSVHVVGYTAAVTSVLIDDFWVLNGAGTDFTASLGAPRIFTRLPTSAGTTTQWTPSGSAQNWQAVSDIPNDGDATYVSADSSALPKDDLYAITAGMPNTARVLGVVRMSRLRTDGGEASDIRHLVRTNGTTVQGSVSHAPGTGYATHITGFGVNPVTGAPWLIGEINTLQTGIRRNS